MENHVTTLWDHLAAWLPTLLAYLGQLALALIVLVVGWSIINMVTRGMGRMMAASNIEPTLRGFLISVVGLLLKALLLISVASMVGIATTSLLPFSVRLAWRSAWRFRAVLPILPAVC